VLNNINILLVEPTHPGNIGATARAMKTMGLSKLSILNPPAIFPNADSTALAAGADDLLVNANIVTSMNDALAHSQIIFGTSARERRLDIPLLSPEEAAQLIIKNSTSTITLMFGREHAGLTNDELLRCHYHVHIPSNPDYSSLNLAAAVQIMAYEIRKNFLHQTLVEKPTEETIDYAADHQVQLLYSRLEKTLIHLDFMREDSPGKSIVRLRRLFNRARLEKTEFDLLMGLLKAIDKS
jgi:tRNA (cytidine32/uridine32-2'-O)-methyltransferase